MAAADFSNAVRWELPDLAATTPRPPSLAELETIEKAARDEGYARGHAEGHAAGMAEARKTAAQVEALLNAFAKPLAQLDIDTGHALGELAVRIAGVLVGQTYQAQPELLAELVQQALDLLGGERRNVELRLHPNDLATIKPLLTLPEAVKLTADPTLARGDLRCNADSMRIDATLATRLQEVADALGRDEEAE